MDIKPISNKQPWLRAKKNILQEIHAQFLLKAFKILYIAEILFNVFFSKPVLSKHIFDRKKDLSCFGVFFFGFFFLEMVVHLNTVQKYAVKIV